MPSFRNTFAAALLASMQGAYATLDTSSTTNIAVYWGTEAHLPPIWAS